jgi:predicted ester cyclase
MLDNVTDHVDPLTGEVNETTLAEDACQHFDGYIVSMTGERDFIPDKYFDLACIIAEQHEIKTGIKTGIPSSLSNLINNLPSDYF